MTGETHSDESGWTTDTLHAHMVTRYEDLLRLLDERDVAQKIAMNTALTAAEKAVQTAMTAAEKAVAKAEGAAEKRFESVNEFRQTLSDQAGTFTTRMESEQIQARVRERLDDVQHRLDLNEGRARGMSTTFGVLLAVATIVISLVVVFINVLTTK